jgi:hypothetical protein
MNPEFNLLPALTLFMVVANTKAMLVTRAGKKFRRRALTFADAHAALKWCMDRKAAFVLLPQANDFKLN